MAWRGSGVRVPSAPPHLELPVGVTVGQIRLARPPVPRPSDLRWMHERRGGRAGAKHPRHPRQPSRPRGAAGGRPGPAGRIVDFTYVDANSAALAANQTTAADLIGDRVLNRFPEHALRPPRRLCVSRRDRHPGRTQRPGLRARVLRQVRYFDVRAAKVGDGITLTWRDHPSATPTVRRLRSSRRSRGRPSTGSWPRRLFAPIRDGDGRITDFQLRRSMAACAYNEATREELQGSLLSERYPDMWPLGCSTVSLTWSSTGPTSWRSPWAYSSVLMGVERTLDLRGHRVPTGLAVDLARRHRFRQHPAAAARRAREALPAPRRGTSPTSSSR